MKTVRVYAPFPTAAGDSPIEGASQTLREIQDTVDGGTIAAFGNADLPFQLRIVEPPEVAHLLKQQGEFPRSDRYQYILFEFVADTGPLADLPVLMFGKEYVGHEVPGYVARLIADRLVAKVSTAAFAAQIATPGTIALEAPLGFFDDEYVESYKPVSWVLQEAVEFAEKYNWPTLLQLSVDEVVQWLEALPGFLDGQGNGPVGRAVAALSYIVAKEAADHSPIDLAWAMLGLEALYGRGIDSLSRQLAEKTELFLGPRLEHKKSVSMLYDYRSKFLHGSVDLTVAFRQFESAFEDNTFEPEAYEHWGFASAVLVASLQQLVRRGWHSLEFSTVLRA